MKLKEVKLPVFFPDATRGVIRTVDSADIRDTQTPGVLVNTYHLYRELGSLVLRTYGGIRPFMGWDGAVISDSGGFQVMSLAKRNQKRGAITDTGVTFLPPGSKKKVLLTPEISIAFQFEINPDMMVVLDDFTPPGASVSEARETVERTILWAKKCKAEYNRQLEKRRIEDKDRPLLLGVVQGGQYDELRVECAQALSEIGFDGFGFGGWPLDAQGNFQYKIAQLIADHTPKDYFLYGLGIGKPQEIVSLSRMGYHIFDCVLPTRDARHKRLYVYKADSIAKIDLDKPDFYEYYVPDKEKHYKSTEPVSRACDCLLCKNYTRGYLAHLWRIKETTALRLSTIHNLRFYSILMQKLQEELG